MSAKKFLILGGYGIAGSFIAKHLLQYTDVELILAGRNKLKAEAAAEKLNKEFNTKRVTGINADASNYDGLAETFKRCDFVLVASSTAKYTDSIVKAALACGIDYMDINFSSAKLSTLKTYEDEINKSGRCFIIDGGFHPGLPALMVRYASEFFNQMETANVFSLIKENWSKYKPGRATSTELLEEAKNFDSRFYLNGVWYKPKIFEPNIIHRTDFGYPFGSQKAYPMFLSEMEALPAMFPSIKETGFYVGGFNTFVDYFILPGSAITTRILPGTLDGWSNLLEWGLERFSKPPYKTILKLEASGLKDNQSKKIEITLSHEDGYVFTAAPVAACILQYLEMSNAKAGLHFMAHFADPERMLEDMKRMGIEYSIKN